MKYFANVMKEYHKIMSNDIWQNNPECVLKSEMSLQGMKGKGFALKVDRFQFK